MQMGAAVGLLCVCQWHDHSGRWHNASISLCTETTVCDFFTNLRLLTGI